MHPLHSRSSCSSPPEAERSPDFEQVAHIRKAQLDEGLPVAEKVIGEVQVLLLKSLETLDQVLKGSADTIPRLPSHGPS